MKNIVLKFSIVGKRKNTVVEVNMTLEGCVE